MTFPRFAAKHTAPTTPLVTPERMVRHLRERGLLDDYVPPDGIILLYQRRFAREFLAREPQRAVQPYPEWLHLLERTSGRVGVMASFGIGGPAVAAIVDTLAALGTRRFVNLGAAGGLQPGGKVGDLVLCDRAIRDEGLSYHYLPPTHDVRPSAALSAALGDQLTADGCAFTVGATWTIDAPYRETVEELRHYRDEGVLTVEMEAAALFAVAEHRRFDVAAAFVLSDLLTETEWAPDFGAPAIDAGLQRLVEAAIQVLQTAPTPAPEASHEPPAPQG